jgi:hypothetical protein
LAVALLPAVLDRGLAIASLVHLARTPRAAFAAEELNRGMWVAGLLFMIGTGCAYWIVERPKLTRAAMLLNSAAVA